MNAARTTASSAGPLRWVRNLGTARKLTAGFTLVGLLVVAVGVLGLVRLDATQKRLEKMYDENMTSVQLLGELDAGVVMMRFRAMDILVTPDPQQKAALRDSMDELDAEADEALRAYRAVDPHAEVEALEAALSDYRAARDDADGLVPAAVRGDVDAFNRVRKERISAPAAVITEEITELEKSENEQAEHAVDEARDAYARSRVTIVVMIAAAVLLGVGLTVGLTRLIAHPLRRAVEVLKALAAGQLGQRLDVDSRDEVGQMAAALNQAMGELQDSMRSIDQNAVALSAASEELASVSTQMSGSAADSASQAGVVSSAAEQVSQSIATVASGSEQMSASIREIAQNASTAASVAQQAVAVTDATAATMAKLGSSSNEIGNVVKMITSIAEQTNLLALNTTIEAARAGEAGKGFAVVANEVKELAQETSRATSDISRQVEGIQDDTHAAVGAIAEISGIIDRINDAQTTIASAVEEQTATTNEIARSVTEAATGSTHIAGSITQVATAANETTAAASSTNEAAGDLARMAAELQQLVGRFSY